MKGKKSNVNVLLLMACVCLLLPAIAGSSDLRIKQEQYHYQIPLIENDVSGMFVIIHDESDESTSAGNSEPESLFPPSQFPAPLVAHFQISSAEISHSEAQKILSALHESSDLQTVPLSASGFTCTKGTKECNKLLSYERAEAAAELLRKDGFRVDKVLGRGAADLVNKRKLSLNRQVEITVKKK